MTGGRDDIQPPLRYGAMVFVLQVHRDSESTADCQAQQAERLQLPTMVLSEARGL
jgi:hypothetical protein